MQSTYCSLKYHIVFGAKNRSPFILDAWKDRLHAYLGGATRGLGGTALSVGGVSDHVHLLVALKPTVCVADYVRDLKRDSSSWVHEEIAARDFAWQVGYGAFTLGAAGVARLRTYIANQEAHHRTVSWRDELLALCAEAGVEVDMKYFD